MEVIHEFQANLTAPGNPPVLHAVQYDGARQITAQLYAGTAVWAVPEGVTAGITYTLPNRQSGYYETLSDGTAACAIVGNTVTAVLAPVLTSIAGEARVSIVFTKDGTQLSTFPFRIRVDARPGEVNPGAQPDAASPFVGKLYYGGDMGAPIPLGLGNGMRVAQTEDGSLRLIVAGSGNGSIAEETDPTVPEWAKQLQKPSYTAEEVGAEPVGRASVVVNSHNNSQYAHGDIRRMIESLTASLGSYALKSAIPDKVSQLQNDSGYLTQHQDVSGKADKNAMTLGIHTDGLIYLFVDGNPVGSGIQMVSGGDVLGYVDSQNNIIVQGSLADGQYTVKYEMEDGSTIEIGELVLDSNVYYSVTNNLTNCVSSNSAVQVAAGGSYAATITANAGYELESVTVTMGGEAVTVSGVNISIAAVTGDIVITAVAKDAVATEPTNFAEPNTTNTTEWSIWCNDARFGGDGAYRQQTGNIVTNYIPMAIGDTLRFEGLTVATAGTSMTNGLAVYTEDKAVIAPSYLSWWSDSNYIDIDVTDGVYTITLKDSFSNYTNSSGKKGAETAYVRISGVLTGTVDDVVINVQRNGVWL